MQTSCVLLIEDDELTSAWLELPIENSGFGVFSAPSVAVAREVPESELNLAEKWLESLTSPWLASQHD